MQRGNWRRIPFEQPELDASTIAISDKSGYRHGSG
jgi:hypothetical protein